MEKRINYSDIFDTDWNREEIKFSIKTGSGFEDYRLECDWQEVAAGMVVEEIHNDFSGAIGTGPGQTHIEREANFDDITVDEVEAFIIRNFNKAILITE